MFKKRLFGPSRDEMTGWIQRQSEELHNVNSLSSTIRMMRSRRMRWAGHVAQIGKTRNARWLMRREPEKRKENSGKTKIWLCI
jgi:hypothetical protein